MGLLGTTTQQSYYTGSDFGTYQFVNLDSIIDNFMYVYVGENKIINKVNRTDVQFHAMRALQELSYDVLRSFKSQEIEVPNTLKMVLPQDYVNYIKLTKSGSDGIEKVLYPTGKTSNPFAITQTTDGSYSFDTQLRTCIIIFPANGAADITDGDRVNLLWKMSPDTTRVDFIFDKDNDINDSLPATSIVSIKKGISLTGSETRQELVDKFINAASQFDYYTITDAGNGAVQIVYPAGISSGTGANTTSTEGAYSAGVTDGGSNGTNIVVGITAGGTVSGSGQNLLEQTPSNTLDNFSDQTETSPDSTDATDIELDYRGRRYGLDPQHAQANGTFYIDNLRGYIHFGSALSGDTVILKYVSDGLGTDSEMVIHKFCEEACYKWIMYGVLSGRSNIPEYLVQRFKKEKFAETRKAKIRLSNIKIEEFTQVLKGMSKQIK